MKDTQSEVEDQRRTAAAAFARLRKLQACNSARADVVKEYREQVAKVAADVQQLHAKRKHSLHAALALVRTRSEAAPATASAPGAGAAAADWGLNPAALQQELDDMRAKLRTAQSTITALRNTLVSVEARLVLEQSQCASLREQERQAESDHARLSDEAVGVVSNYTRIKAQLSDAIMLKDQKTAEAASLAAKLEEAGAKLAALRAKEGNLKRKVQQETAAVAAE
jgi:hypothetical protein